MKLVPNWKQSWKWFSNWAHGAQVLLIITWAQLPNDLKTAFPPRYLIILVCTIFALGVIGRNIDQTPKAKPE